MSQVTENTFDVRQSKKINKVIKHLKKTCESRLMYETMKWKNARIIVYSDGSHASNDDLSSQWGYLIFITDGTRWHLIHAKSYKSRRVFRSPLAAEKHSVVDAAYMAILLQADVRRFTGQVLEITLLTDSKSLFDVLSKVSVTLEKRLMIHMHPTWEAYDRNIIVQLG